MKNTIVRDTLILFIITLLSGLALGGVHDITLEPIKRAQEASANATYREIFTEADSFAATEALTESAARFNETATDLGFGKVSVDEVLEAKDASGNIIGYVVNASSKEGYNGTVTISVGIDMDKKMTGLGFLSISETPGLGMKATEPKFKDQFAGKDASKAIEMVKLGDADDNQFNAVSGASYTSGAVSGAVNAAIAFVNENVF